MTLRTAIAIATALLAGAAAAQEAPSLTTQKERRSYAIGVDVGTVLRGEGIDLEPALVLKGLEDALAGKKTVMTTEEVRAVMEEMQQELRAKQMAERQRKAAENKKASEAFLAENKAKEGVVTLPSGLQYKVLKAGDGAKPGRDDTVVCHYRGTLVDGTEFGNSYTNNEPLTIPIARSIPGWMEALPLMQVGSKWQVVLPPSLAYGERGTPGPIGPNAVLIFDLELLSIKEKTAPAATAVPGAAPPSAAPAAPNPVVKPAPAPPPKPVATPTPATKP